MLVSLIKFTLAFHISIANRLTFATNVSLNCNTSDIYIFISSNIHIKFDLNVINNVNAEYNKKRMYEFLFLSSFVPEKITDHYREANRGATETIFDALISVPNKGLQTATQPVHCIVLSWIWNKPFDRFVWKTVIVDELSNGAFFFTLKLQKGKRKRKQ